MRQASCCLLVLFSLWSPLLSQETPPVVPSEGTLRVASWNLLNLFDNEDDPGHSDQGTDPKSFADLKVTVAVIDSMNADVLGVQEVENRRVLQQLNRCLQNPYPFVELIEGNDPRGIDVGILSRFPIEQATSHRLRDIGNGRRFSRDFPLFRIRITEALSIEFGVVHLKSKRGKKAKSDAQRLAEATQITSLIKASRLAHPKMPLVVMGDFNDLPTAATLAPLFGVMSDAMALLPEEQRVSYVYRNKGQQIDLVMHTPDLRPRRARFLSPPHNPSDHAPALVEFVMARPLQRPKPTSGRRWPSYKRAEIHVADLPGLASNELKEVRVTGKVLRVHRPKSGRSATLNFHENYREACTAYIPSDAFSRLPDLDGLVGKTVTLIGPVCRYRGTFQIKITNASQLIVSGTPK